MLARVDAADRLAKAASVIRWVDEPEPPPLESLPGGLLYTGVDLGTAYLTVVVVDEAGEPLAGEIQFAEVSRDGLVVDFIGAVDRLKACKARLEKRLGRALLSGHSGFPPGVPQAEVRATGHVLEAAGFECSGLTDEPSAANAVLGNVDGAIVDVGGGTTGIALLKDGKVVYSADEATGGRHFSLVIAGALGISLEEAEQLKTNPDHQTEPYPLVRPVMEKVASIVQRHIAGHSVAEITLVGGTSAFPGIADVLAEYCGIPSSVSPHPVFVTPLGLAYQGRMAQTATRI